MTTHFRDKMSRAKVWYDFGYRPYHNLDHAKHVLKVCKLICFGNISKELEYAAVFHDAVYIPGFFGNEEASAQALINEYPRQDFIKTSAELIRRTAITYHLSDTRLYGDIAVLLDADLSSLAADYATFKQNQINILNENGLDETPENLGKSSKFLVKIRYVREFIYHTDYGRANFEKSACENIAKFYVDHNFS